MLWIALGYAVLLVPASLVALVFCRAARLSEPPIDNAEREVLLWGSLPPFDDMTIRDAWIAQQGLAAPEFSPELSSDLSPYS